MCAVIVSKNLAEVEFSLTFNRSILKSPAITASLCDCSKKLSMCVSSSLPATTA